MKFVFSDEDAFKHVTDEYNRLPKSVKEFISNRFIAQLNDLLIDIDDCESPIEQLFGLALSEYAPKRLDKHVDDYFILPQYVMEGESFHYRVDFLVDVLKNGELKRFVIECDGHDYHEKTKQQARRDKERDRNLMKLGFKVMRFTGSEIFENPIVCAREALNIICEETTRGD